MKLDAETKLIFSLEGTETLFQKDAETIKIEKLVAKYHAEHFKSLIKKNWPAHRRQIQQPTTAKERRKSLQRTRPIRTATSDPDEIQVQVEMVQSHQPGPGGGRVGRGPDSGGPPVPLQITSDGDDTLNAWRVPSLEKDEETAPKRPRPGGQDYQDEEEEEDPVLETEPLLIHDDDDDFLESVVIEMAQHER